MNSALVQKNGSTKRKQVLGLAKEYKKKKKKPQNSTFDNVVVNHCVGLSNICTSKLAVTYFKN